MFTETDRHVLYSLYRSVNRMNAVVDSLSAEITTLQAQVANDTAVETSALTLIDGIQAQIAAAVAAATAAGATQAQLAQLASLSAQLATNNTALAAAVAANTPAAPSSTSSTTSTSST